MRKTALSIAGSDPSGGAGIQADLKVFALLGVFGMAIPAALTAQNTERVLCVKSRPAIQVRAELDALLADVRPGALKTGMLLTADVVSAVAETVMDYKLKNLVVDPVIISSSGKRLLSKGAEERVINELLPLALLVMPNVAEAERLSGIKIESVKDAEEASKEIRKLGPKNVLIKGGHLPNDGDAVDVLFTGGEFIHFRGRRVDKVIHGAGCVYSAAVTAGLAKGLSVEESVRAAKKFISKAIQVAGPVGKGRVPLV